MLLEKIKNLQEKHGWNILPLGQFIRHEDGKKEVQFLAPYTEYRDKMYPIESFPPNTQHILIMTGKISNLTVIDIDSNEALQEFEEALQEPIQNICDYIVKTSKGMQLFFKYEPKLKSTVKYQNSDIDILSDNYQTFASPLNPSYTMIKDGKPSKVPEKVLDFFTNIETVNKVSENIRKSKEAYYTNPFIDVIQQFVDAKTISKKLKTKLEEKFCKNEFDGANLEDFKKGNRSMFLARIAAVLSIDPTIDKTAYEAFMMKFNNKFTQMNEFEFSKRFIGRYINNQATFVDEFTGEYIPLWSYNPNWEVEWEKHKNNSVLKNPEYKVWRDLEEGKYALYHIPSNSATLLAKQLLIDHLKHMGENVNSDDGIQTHMFPSVSSVFDPTRPSPFFKDEFGREFYNSFKRTELMEYFLVAEAKPELPYFIGKVLNNIFPEKETRDLFLHNLAHHLRYLRVGMTSMIVIGTEGGEGKGVILDELMGLIYGQYYTKVSTKTFTSNFNGELKNKLSVYLDESDGRFNDTLLENLKRVIGNSTYELRVKNRGTYDVSNNMMITISSNKDVPVNLDSNRDRRFNVSRAKHTQLMDFDWFREVKREETVIKRLEKEVRSFVEYLAGLETNDIQYSQIIENESRKQLKQDSKTTLELVIQHIAEKDFPALRMYIDEFLVEMFEDRGFLEVAKLVKDLEARGIKAQRRITPLVAKYDTAKITNISVDGKTHSCLDVRTY